MLMILAILAAVAAACGGQSTEESATGADESGAAVSEEEVDTSGTLRYGAANEVTRFDPHRSSNGYDQNWLAPVYERLIDQNPDAEPQPGLATDWEFVDDTTFEMTLREGVTFHDGTPFDAEAVKANIERALTVEGSGVANYLASVDAVEVVSHTEVRFLLKHPDATLPQQLATRPGMMLSPAAFENPDLDRNPVGTGPFRLVSYQQGDRAVYERNEDYWGDDYALVQRLEILYLPDSATRLNALRSGQIDATVIDAPQVPEVERTDLELIESPSIEVYHFQMDRSKSEFGEVLVRQAINHAIDREAIAEALLFGYADPTQQWVPEGTKHHVAEVSDRYEYDPERARQLLAEAGLPDGFSFDAMVSVQPVYVRLGEILQQQFAEVGIDMNLRQEPQLADAFFARQASDAIVSPYPGRLDPTETTQIYFDPNSFSNPGGHSTAAVEAAYEQALQPAPQDERTEAVKELGTQLVEDALGAPILFPRALLAHRQGVVGLQWWLSGHIEFEGVGVER